MKQEKNFYQFSISLQTKKNWIDFNAGSMLTGQDLSEEFMQYILRVANGEETCNERNGYREIAIFKDGVTL